MINVALSKSETLNIYDALDKHPSNLYKRVWKRETETIAIFLNERETHSYSRKFVTVTAIMEFDFSIDSYQDETDYQFEHGTDEPVGELRLIAAGCWPWDAPSSYSGHRIQEYAFLLELGVMPAAFEMEIKCLFCKTTIKIYSQDIEKDGKAKCKSCGTRIRPVY